MGAEGEMRFFTCARAGEQLRSHVRRLLCLSWRLVERAKPHVCARRSQLTVHVFRDGLRERLDAARKIPGILLDVETQPFGAVHLRLHLQMKLCGEKKHAGRENEDGMSPILCKDGAR